MRTKKATERTEIEEKRSSNWKRKFTIQFLHISQENIPNTARTQDKDNLFQEKIMEFQEEHFTSKF